MSKILIIGGGAAGMMAGVYLARAGHEVHILEKNEKLGKKVYITGKGRCNVTNNCDTEELFRAVMSNPKFLYSAFYSFTPQDVMEFFEEAGVPLKTERGNRVFPVSDHSSDIIRGLERELKKAGAHIHLRTEVKTVKVSPYEEPDVDEKKAHHSRVTGVELADGSFMEGDHVLVATGGLSYQSTGSTGDGYRFAEETGHKVKELSPSLVPLKTKEDYIPRLQGLSLKNTELTIKSGKKVLFRDFGEMMFTHFGVTGPLILSASSYTAKTARKKELSMFIDLKPALSKEQLDHRILRDFEEAKNRQFKNALGGLFPAKLTPVMIELSGINPEKKVNEVSREERLGFVGLIKNLPLTVTGLRDYNEAIITKGGIKVKEINPSTMESKLVNGLYFAGEVLDLDAYTGGFNLQIAWSTGYLAGTSAAV